MDRKIVQVTTQNPPRLRNPRRKNICVYQNGPFGPLCPAFQNALNRRIYTAERLKTKEKCMVKFSTNVEISPYIELLPTSQRRRRHNIRFQSQNQSKPNVKPELRIIRSFIQLRRLSQTNCLCTALLVFFLSLQVWYKAALETKDEKVMSAFGKG